MKLTNNGKPHICGEIALTNSPNGEAALCPDCHGGVDTKHTEEVEDRDLLEVAWGIIANAYGGDWDLAQNKDWKPAAEEWRDNYHKTLNKE